MVIISISTPPSKLLVIETLRLAFNIFVHQTRQCLQSCTIMGTPVIMLLILVLWQISIPRHLQRISVCHWLWKWTLRPTSFIHCSLILQTSCYCHSTTQKIQSWAIACSLAPKIMKAHKTLCTACQMTGSPSCFTFGSSFAFTSDVISSCSLESSRILNLNT